MLDRILTHLERLVAADTRNPPRAIAPEHPALAYAGAVLAGAGCAVDVEDLGDGCLSLLATRGATTTLAQCHLDTVPADAGWSRDPFALSIEGDRAHGLGACDIKGAAAGMLAAIESTDGPAAVLFTTDEEAGTSRCVRAFLERDHGVERVVVAEPTGARGVTAHRGIVSYEVAFAGTAGHASRVGAAGASAVHRAVRWGAAVLERAAAAPLNDLRLNLGVIEGGTKANVAASSARIVLGLRPPAGADVEAIVAALAALAEEPATGAWTRRFVAPGLAGTPGAAALRDALGAAPAPAVDFWTEAALFGAAGLDALVLGPGSIEQAHAADEFVPLGDLEAAARCYARLFDGTVDACPALAGLEAAR